MRQRLFGLQSVDVRSTSLQRVGHVGGAEGEVVEPGAGQTAAHTKGKVVDLATLQGVTGVVLVSLVPGQNAPLMFRSWWTYSEPIITRSMLFN